MTTVPEPKNDPLRAGQEARLREAVRRVATGRGSSRKAINAASSFVEATASLSLRDLNECVAIIRDEEWSARRSVMVKRWWKPRRPPEQTLTWLDLMSWDGFRRERMIRSIAGGLPNSFLFAVLLHRLNDWVPQVRAAACEVVPVAARATEPGVVATVLLSLLPRTPTWGRTGPEEMDTLLDLLTVPSVTEAVCAKLRHATSGPAATALTQALRRDAMDPHLETLTEAVQPAVRARAYRTLLDGRARWTDGYEYVWTDKSMGERKKVPAVKYRTLTARPSIEGVLTRALVDRSAAVRRVGGDALIAHRHDLGAMTTELAKRLAADPYPSLAERGRWLLDRTRDN